MKYSIGEFSRMTSLSVKTLRLYHEKELLIPVEVEEFSSYRYYNDRNYEIARAIKILRSFDFSLAEIKDILDECTDESDMMQQLHTKLNEVQEKIRRYQDIFRSIELIIQNESESTMKKNHNFEIEERVIEIVLIAGHRIKGRYDEVGRGFSLVAKKLGRHINGKPMALYYDDEYKENDADFEACFPVRKGVSTPDISIRELTGGKAVCLLHKGPYDTLGDSYKKLYAYLNEKGYEQVIPSREIYLKGPGIIFKGNPKNYLTEIVILVK